MAEGLSPSLQSPQTTVECEKCGADVDVTWFCKNCPASLCNTCKEDHSKDKLLKKHEVVPRSGSVLWSHGSWKLKEPCKVHKNSDLVTYCNDCKLPCCIDCMVGNHRRHDLTKLNTKYFEAESRLNSFVDDLSKSSIQTIQSEMSLLKLKIEACNEDFNHVNSELNAAEIKLQKVVSESFATLRKDLILKQSKITSDIEDKIKSCEHQLREIENIIARTEQKIRKGVLDLIEYFPTSPLITSSHSEITTPIPRFIVNEGILKECRDDIDKICLETIESRRNEAGGSMRNDKEKVSLPDIEVKILGRFKASTFGRSCEPADDDTIWMSSDWHEKIYLYNEAGNVVRSIEVQGSNGIYDMAVQNNDDIIVACCDKKVRRVSMDGKITVLIDTTPFFPSGVCLTEREEIIICMSGQRDKNHVIVYTPGYMSKVRKIEAMDRNMKQLFTDPYSVVFNDGQITVLNRGDIVVSVDQNSGKLLWVYDGGQTYVSKKFYSQGMCRDKFSNYLVTDYNNHCIHYIDNKGCLIKNIMVKKYGLESPWGICVDSQSGRVWCGSGRSQEVVILKYLK